VKLTRTWSIVLLPLSFATVMAFQNCAPVGSSGVIETASTNKSNDATGNGGTPNPTEPNPEPQPLSLSLSLSLSRTLARRFQMILQAVMKLIIQC
jgi:hypothetical protein